MGTSLNELLRTFTVLVAAVFFLNGYIFPDSTESTPNALFIPGVEGVVFTGGLDAFAIGVTSFFFKIAIVIFFEIKTLSLVDY